MPITAEDISEQLNLYDNQKGWLRTYRKDQRDIISLRSFFLGLSRDNRHAPLSPADMYKLAVILTENVTHAGHLSFVIFNVLKLKFGHELLESVSILQSSNTFNEANLKLVLEHKNPKSMASAIRSSSNDTTKAAAYLQILTLEDDPHSRVMHMQLVEEFFKLLGSAHINTQKNMELYKSHPNLTLLVNALKMLESDNLLDQSTFDVIKQHAKPLLVSKTLCFCKYHRLNLQWQRDLVLKALHLFMDGEHLNLTLSVIHGENEDICTVLSMAQNEVLQELNKERAAQFHSYPEMLAACEQFLIGLGLKIDRATPSPLRADVKSPATPEKPVLLLNKNRLFTPDPEPVDLEPVPEQRKSLRLKRQVK